MKRSRAENRDDLDPKRMKNEDCAPPAEEVLLPPDMWRIIVGKINCSVGDWLRLRGVCTTLQQICQLFPLKRLVVSERFLPNRVLTVFPKICALDLCEPTDLSVVPNLVGLSFSTSEWNRPFRGGEWNSITNLTNLRTLWLGCNNRVIHDSHVSVLTNLRELDLARNQAITIDALKALPHLQSLDLSYNRVIQGSSLRFLTQLTKLNMTGSPKIVDQNLKLLTNLTFLKVKDSSITTKAISVLTNLTTLIGNDRTLFGYFKDPTYENQCFRYDGPFNKGSMTDKGIFTFTSKATYQGQWLLGAMDGEGIFNDQVLSVRYGGTWENGKVSGQGVLTDPQYGEYTGGFRQGEVHGKGTLVEPDGTAHEGIWEHGRLADKRIKARIAFG